MNKMASTYWGWKITYRDLRLVTGKWRAERFGVGMCAGSAESLKRMIDLKVWGLLKNCLT